METNNIPNELICFIANQTYIIKLNDNKTVLQAREKATAINKAMIIDTVMDSFISPTQFIDENVDNINKKIHTFTFDPILYEKVRLGAKDNFAIGYRVVGTLFGLTNNQGFLK